MLGPGMVPRYALFSTAAMAAAVPLGIWLAADRPPLVATLLCMTFVVSFGQSVADSLRPGRHPVVHRRSGAPRELTGSDTLDRGYLGLATITGIRVNGYRDFTSSHRDFYLHTVGSHWLLDKLRQDRAVLEELDREPGSVLYHVRMP